MSLTCLGRAECVLDEQASSKTHLTEALKFELDRGYAGGMLGVLAAVPLLLVKEGKLEDALGLVAFILCQSQAWQEVKDKVQGLYEELVAEPPPPVVAAAREWGESRIMEEVCEVVLAWLA